MPLGEKGSRLLHSRQQQLKLIPQMKKANPDYTVHELCSVFGTSISTYYYQCRQKPIKYEERVLLASIKTIAIETGHCYGKRRMHASLLNRGFKIGLYRTATLMKKANVFAITPRKRHYYPKSGKTHIKAANLLERQFYTPRASSALQQL